MRRVRKKKIEFFQEQLLVWYEEHGRMFPWREDGLADYQYVIAEVLLQRTKAETVAKFYTQFIIDFPDWHSLAEAYTAEIEEYLKPIGLYRQRSVRLQNLAREMVRRNGVLPRDRAELESIPFMGQYIANAVELVIFNEPSPLVDVNMARVIERFFGPREMADIRYDPYLQATAYKISNHVSAKKINWAVLDLSALVCKARRPMCVYCPLQQLCKFLLNKSH